MPWVIVEAYANLSDILGGRIIEVFTPAKTVGELIDFLAERYGSAFREMLIDSVTQNLKGSYRILVNGQNIESLDKLRSRICEEDRILFFPPVSGG